MKQVIIVLLMVASVNAKADGFVCESESGLNIKVYNHTRAEDGTRNAHVMVVSDPSLQYGNKTIAKFTDVKKTLSSNSQTYIAKVDLRVTESTRKGENIGGTKLGQLDMIVLSVDFSYAAPVAEWDEVTGTLTLMKRNGDEIVEQVSCGRYLKN